MTGLRVGEGTQVTLHFSLSLENGEEVDSNFSYSAATFTFGDGSLLPGFEAVLVGLAEGAQEEFLIPPEAGFGLPKAANLQSLARASFDPSMPLSEGLVVSFRDASGGELPGVIKTINDSKVIVDFNHPLAGRAIVFRVHILSVVPAVSH